MLDAELPHIRIILWYMKKDCRWKIWLFIQTELKASLPAISSFFQSEDLTYDYENVWEWITGYSSRFKTHINLSRRHDSGNVLYKEPAVIITDFSQPASGALEATEEIALAMTAAFGCPVYFGWATMNADDRYTLEPLRCFQRLAEGCKIMNENRSCPLPRPISAGEQDRNAEGWEKLSEYAQQVAAEQTEEFIPLDALGPVLFAQIKTLPASVGALRHITKVQLYGSSLKYLPPQIGNWASLQYFDSYTSYDLHWFPYEITRCTALKDSRVSTRALYGNYKNRMPFPDLCAHIIRYEESDLACSICRKKISYEQTNQLWISLKIGTDVLPLLVNACSDKCLEALPAPPIGYLPWPHKGGKQLVQPLNEEEIFLLEMEAQAEQVQPSLRQTERSTSRTAKVSQLIRLVRKIWDKK